MTADSNPMRRALVGQLDIAWALASHHLDSLTTDECLWRPARRGLHVARHGDGTWIADWPDHEGYDLGPPSIGWLTWHMLFWWSMVIEHSFGDGRLRREAVTWPGSADAARDAIRDHHSRWRASIEALTDADLGTDERTRWPFAGRPFAEIVAWANIELAKNAAEIGYARFLYAVRQDTGPAP